MDTVQDETFSEELPTRPAAHIPSPTLALAARVNRLAELAIERLQSSPDGDAVRGALSDLRAIQSVAGAVLR